MVNFYHQFISKGQLCFDIGANVGERTDCFVAIGAEVVSAEPQLSCFQHLKKRFNSHQLVHLENCALGGKKGKIELLLCDETTECATVDPAFIAFYGAHHHLHWNRSEEVTLTTLDELIKQYGLPHFCKIDVEGEVLKGLSQTISVIMFEFNRQLLQDTRNCIETLGNLGNYHFNYITFENMHLELPVWQTAEELLSNLNKYITEDVLTGEIVAKLQ